MSKFEIGDKVITKTDVDITIAGYPMISPEVCSIKWLHIPAGKPGIIKSTYKDTCMVQMDDGTQFRVYADDLKLKTETKRYFDLHLYLISANKHCVSAAVIVAALHRWAFACDGQEARKAGTETCVQWQVQNPEDAFYYSVEPEWLRTEEVSADD